MPLRARIAALQEAVLSNRTKPTPRLSPLVRSIQYSEVGRQNEQQEVRNIMSNLKSQPDRDESAYQTRVESSVSGNSVWS